MATYPALNKALVIDPSGELRQTMTARYSDNKFTFNGSPTVIGVDLRNAPHLIGTTATSGSCWTGDTAANGCPISLTSQNWPVAAEAAGNAILTINPRLLIFVEGSDCYDLVCGWQGGNLMGVATNPVVLRVPNQLVYCARDYGPALFRQNWFNANTTAAGSQGQWFQSLVAYLETNPSVGWTYRALSGEDNYGLLNSQYDATPLSPLKQSHLQSIQFPLTGGASTPPN